MGTDFLKGKIILMWVSKVSYSIAIIVLIFGGLIIIRCITNSFNETNMSITIPIYKDVQVYESTLRSEGTSFAATNKRWV